MEEEELITEALARDEVMCLLGISDPQPADIIALQSAEDAPDLSECAALQKNAEKVVRAIQSLTRADGIVCYSADQRALAYAAICYLVSCASHSGDAERAAKLEAECAELRRENERAKEEIGNAYRNKINTCKYHFKKLEERYTAVIAENTSLNIELTNMKSEVEGHRKTIKELNANLKKAVEEKENKEKENEKLANENNDLKKKITNFQNKTNVKKMQQVSENNNQLQNAVSELSKQYQTQMVEIKNYQNTNAKLVQIISQNFKAFGVFEKIISEMQKNQSYAKKQSDDKYIEKLNNKIKILEKENKELKSPDVNNYIEIKKSLNKKFGDCNVNDFINSNLEMKEKIDRLQMFTCNLLQFLIKLVNSGDLDLMLISPDSEIKQLNTNSTFKNQILKLIAKCKQFLAENKILLNETDDLILTKLYSKENNDNDELFNALSLKIIQCGIYQKLYNQKSSNYKSILSELSQMSDFVNCKDDKSLHIILVEKLKEMKKITENIINTINNKNYNINNIDSIFNLMKDMMKNILLYKNLEKDIRKSIKFDGNIKDLPERIRNYENNVKEQYNNAMTSEYKKFELLFSQIKNELIQEKEKSDKYINNLSSEIQSKNDEIKNLKNEISQLIKENESNKNSNNENNKIIKEEYDKLEKNYNKLREDNKSLKNENTNLNKMNQKQKEESEEKLNLLINQEREYHAKEIQNISQRNKNIEQQYQEKIKSLNTKYLQLKSKFKEALNQYISEFSKQRDKNIFITKQNEKLKAKLQQKETIQNEEKNQLNSKIEILNSQNQVLLTKLKQNSEKHKKNITIRDNYWTDQLSLSESKLTKQYESKIEDLSTKHHSLIESIFSSLHLTPPPPNASDSALIKAITDSLDNHSRSSSKSAVTEDSYRKVFRALQEWDRWARDLYINVSDGDVASGSSRKLRRALSDAVISSVDQRSLTHKLESLRLQKRILLSTSLPHSTSPPPATLRALTALSTGLLRALRMSGHSNALSTADV